MNLDQALHILARVHTADDERAGFQVRIGAMPEPFNCVSSAEYIETWKAVREHLHFPVTPGQYPK